MLDDECIPGLALERECVIDAREKIRRTAYTVSSLARLPICASTALPHVVRDDERYAFRHDGLDAPPERGDFLRGTLVAFEHASERLDDHHFGVEAARGEGHQEILDTIWSELHAISGERAKV